MSPAAQTLRVRMYNVGFGDGFLVVLPGAPPRTVLVDAGFHSQGKGAFSGPALAQRIIEDVTAIAGRPRIDVVVATHRHQDHVFAFNATTWDEVEVGEVWLPWMEDRKNAAARRLWKKKHAFAQQLRAALPGFGLEPGPRAEVEFLLWNAGEGPLEAWSNAAALDRLMDGFARRDREAPRFLPAGEEFPETFETDALPGVRIHVLGPPRDADLLAELDPERDGDLPGARPAGGGPEPGSDAPALRRGLEGPGGCLAAP